MFLPRRAPSGKHKEKQRNKSDFAVFRFRLFAVLFAVCLLLLLAHLFLGGMLIYCLCSCLVLVTITTTMTIITTITITTTMTITITTTMTITTITTVILAVEESVFSPITAQH